MMFNDYTFKENNKCDFLARAACFEDDWIDANEEPCLVTRRGIVCGGVNQ